MIFDKVENLPQYFDKPWVNLVLDFYKTLDVNTPNGEYELMGRDLYCKVLDYETKTTDFITESHRKYVDIQISLDGEEIIEVNNFDSPNLSISENYNEINDCIFYNNSLSHFDNKIHLRKDFMAIFFPQDIHTTQILSSKIESRIKKVVFKLNIDIFKL
ncbi:EbgC Beta-galactosidase, beta subunit [Spirosomataceae bacterium]